MIFFSLCFLCLLSLLQLTKTVLIDVFERVLWDYTIKILKSPCGSAGKESPCNARDLGLIPGLGRSPGEGKDYPLQYSGLENCVNCIVNGSQRVRHD